MCAGREVIEGGCPWGETAPRSVGHIWESLGPRVTSGVMMPRGPRVVSVTAPQDHTP